MRNFFRDRLKLKLEREAATLRDRLKESQVDKLTATMKSVDKNAGFSQKEASVESCELASVVEENDDDAKSTVSSWRLKSKTERDRKMLEFYNLATAGKFKRGGGLGHEVVYVGEMLQDYNIEKELESILAEI